jgi:hypothetical protein
MDDHSIPSASEAINESMEAVIGRAKDRLRRAADGIRRWLPVVRAADPGRFRWAAKTTRDANVAATSYTLTGLKRMGLFDELITEADKREGVRWIRSLAIGNGEYRDPALVDRKTPGRPADRPWPDSGMLETNNRYAQNVLAAYGEPDPADSPPPPGWPQLEDGPQAAVAWIKERPWHESSWGSGSWSAKMLRRLLEWHMAGHMSMDPLLESLRFIHEIQDPDSGLWGDPSIPVQNRINGTFKLFGFLRADLDLPLRHAEKIIDQVLARFYEPDYEDTAGGCDEFDNWFVVLHALPETNDHRGDEVRKLSALRISAVLDRYKKEDGGISYNPQACQTTWVGFDMAPALPQGDAMGLGLITAGVCTCVELCGLAGATDWQGHRRLTERYDRGLMDEIAKRLGL